MGTILTLKKYSPIKTKGSIKRHTTTYGINRGFAPFCRKPLKVCSFAK
jgi:hypothetical protein